MQRRRAEIDMKLLLFAITKTQQFEILLAKRFTGETYKPQEVGGTTAPRARVPDQTNASETKSDEQLLASSAGGDNVSLNAETIQSPFIDLIGACFKPFLDIYTDSVDRNLAEIMERLVQESAAAKPNQAVNNSAVFPRYAFHCVMRRRRKQDVLNEFCFDCVGLSFSSAVARICSFSTRSVSCSAHN